MAGGLLALLAMFLPWVHFSTSFGAYSRSGIDTLMAVGTLEVVCSAALLVGAFLAFLNSFAGLLQLGGVAGFMVHWYGVNGFTSWSFGMGIYLALSSAIVVCISIVVPLGIGWWGDKKIRNPFKMSPRDAQTVSTAGGSIFRIDDICVLAAIIGVLVATVTPWTEEAPQYTPRLVFRVYMDIDRNVIYHTVMEGMGAGPAIVLLGILLLFATSLSVMLLLGGLAIFFESASNAASAGTIESVGPGFGLILVPAFLAIISLASAFVGPEYKLRIPSWKDFLILRSTERAKV